MRYEARLWSQCSADPRAARPSSHGPRSLAKCTEGYRQSARGPSVSCVASHAVSADVSESVWPGQGLKCAVLWGAMLFCAGHRIVREIEQFGSDSHLGPIAMHASANAKPCWAPAAVDRAVKGQHYFPRQPENAIVHHIDGFLPHACIFVPVKVCKKQDRHAKKEREIEGMRTANNHCRLPWQRQEETRL